MQTDEKPESTTEQLPNTLASACGNNINFTLKMYQIGATDWEKQDLIQQLHLWAERFIFEFKLKIKIPVIMLDRIGRSRYGHFRPGRNGFGLCNEIAINDAFVNSREFWQVLGTLLHELLHAEQEQTGKPGKNNYHNKAFRKHAAFLGLIIDEWGHMEHVPAPSPFFDVLGKYDITVPVLPEPKVEVAKPGNSKLKLWICECQPQPVRVRVAIKDFRAKCLICEKTFTLATI